MSWRLYKLRPFIVGHIKIFVIICFCLFIIKIFDIKCPIKYFIGIPCPTCGMTTAMIALFHGDIEAYLLNNAMSVPTLIAILLELHSKIFYKRFIIHIACAMILVINIIYYIERTY